MIKVGALRFGRRVLGGVGDRARAGILPNFFQGGLKAYFTVPLNLDHTRRALGVVVGVRKSEHDLVCSAYPEWDLLFASRRADPDHIANECQRLQATAIVGPDIRRRFLMALNSAAINSLSLSHAPLPRLRSANGIARGFTLEPQSSWMTGRRMSDLDVMFDLRDNILTPALRRDAAKLAAAINIKADGKWLLAIEPREGFWTFSTADRAAILETSGTWDIKWLPVPRRYWNDETLDLFDEYLAQSLAIVSMGHPLAILASLKGFQPRLSKRIFRANYALTAKYSSEQAATATQDHADAIDRVAIAVLLAARYVHSGVLVDPVDFVCGTTA